MFFSGRGALDRPLHRVDQAVPSRFSVAPSLWQMISYARCGADEVTVSIFSFAYFYSPAVKIDNCI